MGLQKITGKLIPAPKELIFLGYADRNAKIDIMNPSDASHDQNGPEVWAVRGKGLLEILISAHLLSSFSI